jgi:myosin heavy subunit
LIDDLTGEPIPQEGSMMVTINKDEINFCNSETSDGVADMITLNYLHEPAIQHNIKRRFYSHIPLSFSRQFWINIFFLGAVIGNRV